MNDVTTKLKISLVHYLNAAPLGWAFLQGPYKDIFEVIPSSPAKCADQLLNGDVDIGLIPSIEYANMRDLQIIPGIAIASLAEVRSILLVRPWEKGTIKSVALDTTSRTSVVLTKILLKRVMGIEPEFVLHPPNLKEMLQVCDAALLIGDAALGVNPDEYHTEDLSWMWVQWQKKPFVFAFWACRGNLTPADELAARFQHAKEWGLARRHEISVAFSEKLGLPQDFLEYYLVHNINYDFTLDHIRGLETYYRLAKEEGYISEVKALQFLHPQKLMSHDA